jgi:hypothetical protein
MVKYKIGNKLITNFKNFSNFFYVSGRNQTPPLGAVHGIREVARLRPDTPSPRHCSRAPTGTWAFAFSDRQLVFNILYFFSWNKYINGRKIDYIYFFN